MPTIRSLIAFTTAVLAAIACAAAGHQQLAKPRPLRLYVFDCGLIRNNAVETYGFKQGEVMMRLRISWIRPNISSSVENASSPMP